MIRALILACALGACVDTGIDWELPTAIRLEACCLGYPNEGYVRACMVDALIDELGIEGGNCFDIACDQYGFVEVACRLPDGTTVQSGGSALDE